MEVRSQRDVQILDDLVVNQIAAGEVVERPVSIVKELVENAIDAGSKDISVVISNGGMTSIEVIDDGCGMSRNNALKAIERFGTSKITEADDLLSISTLGFRGEAIPSIASVSKFSLTTSSTQGSGRGTRIEIEGGDIKEVVDQAAPPGTKILVRSLFFNVPARKKFLKTERAETGAIRNLLNEIAAAYPSIRFSLFVDGNENLILGPSKSFFSRVKDLKFAGKDPVEIDKEVLTSDGAMRIQAVLSRPANAVSGATRLRIIVNGRVVRDRMLLKAAKEGYGGMLKPGKFPAGVINISLPSAALDVNVHPQKTEVRFRESGAIFSALARTIRSALGDAPILGEKSVRDGRTASPISVEFKGSGFLNESVAQGTQLGLLSEAPEIAVTDTNFLGASDERKLSDLRYLGQIMHCYLLMEGDDELVVVDMHAAHERVVFARIKEQLSKGENLSQQLLLIPETVELDADRIQQFKDFQPVLVKLGIDCELFGDDSIIVRSVPSVIPKASPQSIFKDFLSLPEWDNWGSHFEEHLDAAVARLACHGSIRSGRDLEREEVYKLLEEVDQVQAGAFCPHGRPIAWSMSSEEIEKRFDRS